MREIDAGIDSIKDKEILERLDAERV